MDNVTVKTHIYLNLARFWLFPPCISKFCLFEESTTNTMEVSKIETKYRATRSLDLFLLTRIMMTQTFLLNWNLINLIKQTISVSSHKIQFNFDLIYLGNGKHFVVPSLAHCVTFDKLNRMVLKYTGSSIWNIRLLVE